MVVKYEARFNELEKHDMMILPIEYERIQCFVRGLRIPLCISTQS